MEIARLLQLRGWEHRTNVYTADCEELTTTALEDILEAATQTAATTILVVYSRQVVTPKKVATYQSLCDLELFERAHLRILLAGHRFMVSHTRLSEEERAIICRTYGEDNLPRLQVTDPMARLYGFKIGDVILIRRPQIYFRRVVPA